ncbi:Acyl carrier protein [Buchnera aphidicola (Thelaxes suberi)]|uniref:acyl carrier protein n=1 Tax=Buchnera aphidicola TaxID=9 RepID=UPI003463EA69
MTSIEKKIKTIISKQFGIKIENILNESNLRTDLKADSLDKIELIMEIEDIFNIEIHDNDVDKFINVQSIIDYVTKKLNFIE